MKKKFFILFFILSIVISSVSVLAHMGEDDNHSESFSEPPIGLQKIIESNKQSISDFAVKISFFIAFVAGILGLLSPCILPFLPAYFSYTFKEKKNITKMTLIFFIGFSLVFVAMGVIAGFIGEQSLAILQQDWLVIIAGVFLIGLGLMTFLGKNVCSYVDLKHKCKQDIHGTFLFGIFFAIGWTACVGPILAGVLGIGAIMGNIWYSALLLFFYSLGNFVPLFILSIAYDRLNLSQSKFMQGKMFKFKVLGKKLYVHSTNLIAGILFLIIGAILIIYKGTGIFNAFDIFGTKEYFYSIQRALIGWEYANLFGMGLFVIFVIGVGIFLLKYRAKNNSKKKR